MVSYAPTKNVSSPLEHQTSGALEGSQEQFAEQQSQKEIEDLSTMLEHVADETDQAVAQTLRDMKASAERIKALFAFSDRFQP